MAKTSRTPLIVPASAYGAGWNGSQEVPTKGDLYSKIETLGGASYTFADDITGAGNVIRRALRSGDDNYEILPVRGAAQASTIVAANNQVRVLRMNFATALTVSKLVWRNGNTVASALSSIGIYLDTVSAPMINSGAVAQNAGNVIITLGSAYNLRPQNILFAFTSNDATSQILSLLLGDANANAVLNASVGQFFTAANSSSGGALPATLGTLTALNASTTIPSVKLQG